ncbi:MAG: hypothetical protein K5836_01685 [Clostridiales bacterium]|nr:hypothetical protein [Clostridiales bacterium]
MTSDFENWEYFRECSKGKRKRLLDHDFKFCLDDIGAGWEYVHFELDGKNVSSFRISYIGPGVREFVECATSLKEKENNSFTFCDEPGEHVVFMSRRRENIYIELPYMDKGFFLKYDKFISAVSEVLK